MKNARVIEVHTLDESGTEHGNPQGQTHLFFSDQRGQQWALSIPPLELLGLSRMLDTAMRKMGMNPDDLAADLLQKYGHLFHVRKS